MLGQNPLRICDIEDRHHGPINANAQPIPSQTLSNSLFLHHIVKQVYPKSPTHYPCILPEHPSEMIVFHNEDGNPARANIKQALGYHKDEWRWIIRSTLDIKRITECSDTPTPLRWHLEEIHVTWTYFRKKRDEIATLDEVASKNCVQCLETASQFLATPSELAREGVKTFVMMSERSLLNETLQDSTLFDVITPRPENAQYETKEMSGTVKWPQFETQVPSSYYCWFKITAVGEKVNAAESLLVVSTKVKNRSRRGINKWYQSLCFEKLLSRRNKQEELFTHKEEMAPMALSDSKVNNDKSCSKSCLKNYEDLKKQYDDLLVKLDDTGFKASTYKRGLSILEGQILKYKEHEVLFSKEIALLKRSVGHKEYLMGLLRTELEKVKEEKEGFEFKIAKFEKSAKDLDQLLANQITDKSKKGFGYNVVPSPHLLILNRPTPLDLSYSGLEEFKQPEVNEYGPRDSSLKPTTGCDKESENSKENTDDSLKQQQKIDFKTSLEKEPKKASENNDAQIIKDWVLDDEDEVETTVVVKKKTVIPTAAKIEKPVRKPVRYAEIYRSQRPRGNQRNWNGQKSNQHGSDFVMHNKACYICGSFDHLQYTCKHKRHVNDQKQVKPMWKNTRRVNDYYSTRMTHSNPRRNMIPQAVLMRSGIKAVNTAKPKDAHNVVKRNWFHDVKASACWVWRPKQKEILDNVSKHNSASMILKRLNYIDVQGRFKWMHRLREGKSAAKKKKNPEKSAAKAERPKR
ncbi:hypothetical protein Tco_1146335 [Tanacetum coccineum]